MPAIAAVQTNGQTELRSLWRTFAATKQERDRDRLALIYLPLVNFVASRLHAKMPAHVDKDDLVGDGLFGLIEAIDRFDPAQGVKFETFAQRRIEGAMLDAIRAQDWAPRSLRSNQRKIEEEMNRQAASGAVDKERVAENLGMTVDEVDETLAGVGRASFHSLEGHAGATDDDAGTLYELVENLRADNPAHELERAERLEALIHAIDGLPERERIALMLFDFEELPLAVIADLLHVTESRVSQLRGQALGRIATRMTGLSAA